MWHVRRAEGFDLLLETRDRTLPFGCARVVGVTCLLGFARLAGRARLRRGVFVLVMLCGLRAEGLDLLSEVADLAAPRGGRLVSRGLLVFLDPLFS